MASLLVANLQVIQFVTFFQIAIAIASAVCLYVNDPKTECYYNSIMYNVYNFVENEF